MPVTGTPSQKVEQEMHRFKHGQLHSGSSTGPVVRDPKQALAIALHVAGLNRPKRADGGASPPWYVKNEARSMLHTGAIQSAIPGRTDHIPMKVPNHSYVLPSQHVSHLGENNTAAGFSRLDQMFKSGPFGSTLPTIHHGRGVPGAPGARAVTFQAPKKGQFADGGAPEGDDDGVPIMAAGGEYVVHPDHVAKLGMEALREQYGDKAHITPHEAWAAGHEILDGWVQRTKQHHAKTIKGLPGPAK